MRRLMELTDAEKMSCLNSLKISKEKGGSLEYVYSQTATDGSPNVRPVKINNYDEQIKHLSKYYELNGNALHSAFQRWVEKGYPNLEEDEEKVNEAMQRAEYYKTITNADLDLVTKSKKQNIERINEYYSEQIAKREIQPILLWNLSAFYLNEVYSHDLKLNTLKKFLDGAKDEEYRKRIRQKFYEELDKRKECFDLYKQSLKGEVKLKKE